LLDLAIIVTLLGFFAPPFMIFVTFSAASGQGINGTTDHGTCCGNSS
jgi:hypothetical protein